MIKNIYLWIRLKYRVIRYREPKGRDFGCSPGVLTWEYLNELWDMKFKDDWRPKS